MSTRRSLVLGIGAVLLSGSLAMAAELRVADLEPHLASPRPPERLAALLALGQIRDAAAVKAAISGARQVSNLTQAEIIALADLLATQDFSAAVALLKDPDKDLVDASVIDLGHRSPEQLEPVVKDLLGGKDEQIKLAQRILEVLLQQGGTTPAHAALALIQFQDTNEYRRQTAVRSLMRQEHLDRVMAEQIAKDTAPTVRVAVVEVLKNQVAKVYRSTPSEALWIRELLHALATDPSDKVRFAAFVALAERWRDRAEGESVVADQELFLTALSDSSPAVRSTAISQFSATPIPAAIPHIERLAGDPEGMVASTALYAARHLGLPNLAQLAFQACSLPNAQNRRVALDMLKELNDPRVVPVATRLLDDPDWEVRDKAQRALAEGNVGVETGVLSLAKVAKLKPNERQALLVRLAQLDPPARLAEITKLYDGMTPEQRRELLTNWSRDPRLAASAGEFLLARTTDQDPLIATAAFDALRGTNERGRALGLPEALARLADRDPKVAHAAQYLAISALQNREGYGGLPFRWILPDPYAERDYPDPDNLPPRPVSPAEIGAFLTTAATAALADKPRYFTVMAQIDDPRALAALQEAARSKDRAIRWAGLDALVRRGDQADATIDHALARLLTTKADELETVLWPLVTPRLNERLNTFTGVAEAAAIARVRAQIERRLAAITALEGAR